MKDQQHIHTGRPFGGIAMLWRKSLNKYISIVTYDCDRIVGLKFESNSFAALFVCVYLPYDCSDNFDNYMFLLAKISQIIDEFQTPYVYVYAVILMQTQDTHHNLVMNYLNYLDATLYV